MEARSLRTLVLLFLAMGVLALVCGALTFILAGDQIAEITRSLTRDYRLSQREDELNAAIGTDSTPIRFDVVDGVGIQGIATSLAQQGFINDRELFIDYALSEGLSSRLLSGVFFLNRTMSIVDLADALTSNDYRSIPYTLAPGQRIEEIAEIMDNVPRLGFTGDAFMAVVGRGAQVSPTFAEYVGLPPGASLEGFLLPRTYQLAPDFTPVMVRDVMLDAFVEATSGEIANQAAEAGYSLFEVVTLASIVQREALFDSERPLIAGVYLNRLERADPDTDEAPPLNLDADPTVQYPLGSSGDWWPQITVADYQGVDSEYNTYRREGLPPGPIANPSLASIQAVIAPEDTDFFYFRADCRDDGLHDFALNYQEHLANGC